jgi:hypothetical protein
MKSICLTIIGSRRFGNCGGNDRWFSEKRWGWEKQG